MKFLVLTSFLAGLTGCATVFNDKQQPITVETITPEGQVVVGTKCSFYTDDDALVLGKAGDTVYVQRSKKDLEITCWHPNYPNAKGFAVARPNIGMASNLLFGSLGGVIIDYSTDAGYSYPDWVQLVFGKIRRIDSLNILKGASTTNKASSTPNSGE